MRSRRLFGPTAVNAGATVLLYTVPSGRTARLGLVTVALRGATNGEVELRLNGTGATSVVWREAVAAFTSREVLDELCLNPGDTLYGVSGAGNAVVAGFGSLLLGEPA